MRSAISLALGLCFLVAGPSAALESETERVTHSTVRLVSLREGIHAGHSVRVGIVLDLEPGWHAYWINPGQSGEAARFRWTLPPGYDADEPNWPVPERFVVGGVVNFGYEHRALLPTVIRATGELRPSGDFEIALRLSWLACRDDICVPATANLALTMPVLDHEPPLDSRWAPQFEAFDRATPPRVQAFLSRSDDGLVVLTIPDARTERFANARIEVFPREEGIIDEAAEPVTIYASRKLEISMEPAASAPASLERLSGVIATVGRNPRRALAFEAGNLPESARESAMTSESAARPEDPNRFDLSTALLFAFVGGLLLNLMPCVFPVLSLKVLGFVERAHGDRQQVRAHGWAFTIGVLLSFWALAATLLMLRAGGEQLGWGFQLQSPLFVALLAYLMFAMALSLAGLAEFGMSLTSVAGRAGTEEGLSGSFWTGALATVVATPCTAPFMGPALGFALTQSSAGAMAIFSALGAGMASPYLVLSYFPSTLARLPRPGPWMETFRKLMAVPLFATAAWLTHVFAMQTGDNSAPKLVAGAVLIAIAMWLWRKGSLHAGGHQIRRAAVAVAMLAIVVGANAARTPHSPVVADASHGTFWKPWSPAHVEESRASGRPVFVNFTASWCLSCKVNEQAIFARTDVRELFKKYSVIALEADWTNENAEIQQTLASFGRDGVPLYVVYPADRSRSPTVLPQIPSYADLETAFQGAQQPNT